MIKSSCENNGNNRQKRGQTTYSQQNLQKHNIAKTATQDENYKPKPPNQTNRDDSDEDDEDDNEDDDTSEHEEKDIWLVSHQDVDQMWIRLSQR